MNFYEVTELINQLMDEDDPDNDELIAFYIKSRNQLIEEIESELQKKITDGLIR